MVIQKFKENKTSNIAGVIGVILLLIGLLSLLISLVLIWLDLEKWPLLIAFASIPLSVISIWISNVTSSNKKYQKYIIGWLIKKTFSKDIEELEEALSLFEETCTKNGKYIFTPNELIKTLHHKLYWKIETLKQQENV